jgi:hypothetical protein
VIYDKEVGDLYSSPNIRTIKSRRVRWTRHVTRIREKMISMGKPEGKRPL